MINHITPHMCEVMYAHYDYLLQTRYMPRIMRLYLQKQQDYYENLYHELVPIDMIALNLFN